MLNEEQHFITSCFAPVSWKPLPRFLSVSLPACKAQGPNQRYLFSVPSYNNTIICCHFLYVAKNMVKKEMSRKSVKIRNMLLLCYIRDVISATFPQFKKLRALRYCIL